MAAKGLEFFDCAFEFWLFLITEDDDCEKAITIHYLWEGQNILKLFLSNKVIFKKNTIQSQGMIKKDKLIPYL